MSSGDRDGRFSDAPSQSFAWLRPFVPKWAQPTLRGIRKRLQLRKLDLPEPYRTVFPYAMGSRARQENLVRIARLVEERGVPGAIVECGVLDGGAAALMASQTGGSGRPVHLFDAWQGLPDTTAADGQESERWVAQVVGSPRRVRAAMRAVGVDPSRLHFHEGWFQDTFGQADDVDTVALLHVDCDFYEPTRLVLETWAGRMAPGGFIQFDDYSEFVGGRTAIDEWLAGRPELSLEVFGTPGQGEAYFVEIPRRESAGPPG